MLQTGENLGLALEARHRSRIAVAAEKLDGHRPMEHGVLASANLGHAAAPEDRAEFVAPAQQSLRRDEPTSAVPLGRFRNQA
jgi:hypothetical protein